MTLDTLKTAAKAVIDTFKSRGLTPSAMEQVAVASLTKAAQIAEEVAAVVREAWLEAQPAPNEDFGRDFSVRLLGELEKRSKPEPAAAAAPPPPTQPKAAAPDQGKEAALRLPSPVPGLLLVDWAKAHGVRACVARGIEPHMPTLIGKARRAAYTVAAGKLEVLKVPSFMEGQIAWLDSKALVAERLEFRRIDADDNSVVSIAQVLQGVEGELSDGVIDAITDIVLGAPSAPAATAEEERVNADPLANGPAAPAATPDPLGG